VTDNRRRFVAIYKAIKKLYSVEPAGIMSRETLKWQIQSFCTALKRRYTFIGYATLSSFYAWAHDFLVDNINI